MDGCNTFTDVSPEDFAAREELNEQAGWAGSEKKNKRKVSLHQHKHTHTHNITHRETSLSFTRIPQNICKRRSQCGSNLVLVTMGLSPLRVEWVGHVLGKWAEIGVVVSLVTESNIGLYSE